MAPELTTIEWYYTGALLFFLVLVLSVASIHYFQHFRFHVCAARPSASTSSLPSINPTMRFNISSVSRSNTFSPSLCDELKRRSRSCRCGLVSVDGSNFKFFPVSFLYYILFVSFLCCLILAKAVLHKVGGDDTENLYMVIASYLSRYGVLLLSLWESLHAFYSCYTTFFCVTNGYSVSLKAVLLRFVFIYGCPFTIVYVINIQYCYWLFPAVVALHFVFNLYCSLRFAALLISSYEIFRERGSFCVLDEELAKVYLMRRVSIICCVLQTVYLCLFLMSAGEWIHYLPALWCISAMIYSLNFIRNRLSMQTAWQQIKNSITCKCHQRSQTVQTRSFQQEPRSPPKPEMETNELNVPEIQLQVIEQGQAAEPEPPTRKRTLTINVEIAETDCNLETALSGNADQCVRSKPNNKALLLLGITSNQPASSSAHTAHHSTNLSILPTMPSFKSMASLRALPSMNRLQRSKKTPILHDATVSTCDTNNAGNSAHGDMRMHSADVSGPLTRLALGVTSGASTDSSTMPEPATLQRPEVLEDHSATPNIPHQPFYAKKIALDFQSLSNPILPKQSLSNFCSAPTWGNIHDVPYSAPFNGKTKRSQSEIEQHDEGVFVEVFQPYEEEVEEADFNEDGNALEVPFEEAQIFQIDGSSNINHVVRSFDVLAEYGFYSKQNINTISQLKKYLAEQN